MGIIIVGTNPYSLTCSKILEKEGIEVLAFSTYRNFITDECFDGKPIIPFEDIGEKYDSKSYELMITIGYSQMNSIRKKVYEDAKKYDYPLFTFISKNAIVYSENIGEGSIIMPQAYIGPFVKIGVCNIINPFVDISHHINIDDFNFIGHGVICGGNSIIKSNCFIGQSSCIKNRIIIESYSLVGAGSNVLKSTEPYSVNVGNPARKLENKNSLNTII